jgi:hypothetical protein
LTTETTIPTTFSTTLIALKTTRKKRCDMFSSLMKTIHNLEETDDYDNYLKKYNLEPKKCNKLPSLTKDILNIEEIDNYNYDYNYDYYANGFLEENLLNDLKNEDFFPKWKKLSPKTKKLFTVEEAKEYDSMIEEI